MQNLTQTTGERLKKKNDIPDCHKRKFKKYSGNKIATFDIIPAGTIVQIFKHFNVPAQPSPTWSVYQLYNP